MLRNIDDIHPFILPIVDLTVHIIELLDKIRCQELLQRPHADHLPTLYRDQSITIHRCDIQVMHSRNHGMTEALHDIHDLELVLDIEMIRRFIQRKALGALRQCIRQLARNTQNR